MKILLTVPASQAIQLGNEGIQGEHVIDVDIGALSEEERVALGSIVISNQAFTPQTLIAASSLGLDAAFYRGLTSLDMAGVHAGLASLMEYQAKVQREPVLGAPTKLTITLSLTASQLEKVLEIFAPETEN